MELDGQVALVTGAGRGIGRAIALELAGLGADVAVAELNAAAAEQTGAEIKQAGRAVLAVRADVTRVEDRQAMVDQTLKRFGRIDIPVNNAGIYRTAPPLEITEDHWDSVLAVNAKAVLFCAQAVLPTMLAARRGVIINVASMAGKVASANSLPYAVSKSAVISLTRSLAAASNARDETRRAPPAYLRCCHQRRPRRVPRALRARGSARQAGRRVAVGSDEIRAEIAPFLAVRGTLTVKTARVVASGEIALLRSRGAFSGVAPDGSPVEVPEHDANEVARRQADGTWLFAVNDPWGVGA